MSVAQRRANAAAAMKRRAKAGLKVDPVSISGRKIATTFWGSAWCDAMERDADFENRLPRGRTYVRNGSVVHLQIGPGVVTAVVSGSELYDVDIKVTKLSAGRWQAIRNACGTGISALSLLKGALDDDVLRVLTAPRNGMIPESGEFKIRCSCPDWAVLCKHAAAVLYGVGARLDRDPALLFTLRGVDMTELVSAAGRTFAAQSSKRALGGADDELSAIFDIDIDLGSAKDSAKTTTRNSAKTTSKDSAKTTTRDSAKTTTRDSAKTTTRDSAKTTTKNSAKTTSRATTEATAKAVAPSSDAIATPERSASIAPGIYTAAELRGRGLSPTMLKRALAAGEITHASFGWYRIAKALTPGAGR